ncbi:hypothetical protein midi_01237 [Candidatus Midichloria mitochondrii IricVA]|uniref:Uncharacterized protein n=1 Tax=Midichloria mitochondrii (strain IricVA) TaxID=696127 RepID=F7XUE9_MIDMI|nr:hypothetical protein midi_01237 [Candidatus Midichloria mitochondrii IricVA]
MIKNFISSNNKELLLNNNVEKTSFEVYNERMGQTSRLYGASLKEI